MSLTTVEARVAGFAGLVVLLALSLWLFRWAGSPPSGSYEVTAVLGDAGSGMFPGGDVKVRDVIVGSIKEIHLDEDANAVATLVLDPQPPLPADVEVLVTDKTVLGEKQIELRFDGSLREGPRLQPGTVLTADPDLQPVPFQDVIADLESLLAAVDGQKIARVVDALAFSQADAEIAGRNLDLLAELSEFSARTADDQVDRLRRFADVAGTLAPAADDINRLNRSLPAWANLLPERQADVRAALESLTRFSDRFATFLRIEEEQIGRFLEVGQIVGAALDPRMQTISEYVFGAYRYSFSLGLHGGSLNDGSEHAWFRVFTDPEAEAEAICRQFPESLRAMAPGCAGDEAP